MTSSQKAIQKAKKGPIRYNKNITMQPMPELFLKSKIFFKTFYPFLFVNELNKTEVLVASYIYTFYEHTKAVFAKPSTLSKYLNIDKGQISRILNHLVELGVIKKEQQGENTLYIPLLDTDEMTQFACNSNSDESNRKSDEDEDEDGTHQKESKRQMKEKEIKKAESAPQSDSEPIPKSSSSELTSKPKFKPKLPPLSPEIQAQLASDNFDMIYYDIPPYYNPSKLDELNLRPSSLRSGIYRYPKPGESDFDVSDRNSPYYDPESDPDNEAYWDWSDDLPVPKKKNIQAQQAKAQTKSDVIAKPETIKPAASTTNTTYWR